MKRISCTFLLPLVLTGAASAKGIATFDGITFANTGSSKVYFPLRELSKHLGWKLTGTPTSLRLNGYGVPASTLRTMADGTRLVDIDWVKKAGAIVNRNVKPGISTVKDAKKPGTAFYVRRGQKRVFINKKTQTLVAYQGQRTILRSNVSTGRRGQETPLGIFRAKGKEKMHKSRLYKNAPMPWSVHVVGNIFLHGFKETPRNGSSGCIRLPLDNGNPARFLYYWTDLGTPITVQGKWPKGAIAAR